MNRTNSVEPVFSQPLQVTYHQLLQSKAKAEDELFQTQRQLRRKEGEYLKKIALYEQKVEQMQELIDEFRERETQTRAMYDKIITTINDHHLENNETIGIDRVQEYLDLIYKASVLSRSSPPAANLNQSTLSVRKSTVNSRRQSETATSSNALVMAQNIATALAEAEKAKQAEISQLEQSFKMVLEEKDIALLEVKLENQRLESEISIVKRDLGMSQRQNEELVRENSDITNSSKVAKEMYNQRIQEMETQIKNLQVQLRAIPERSSQLVTIVEEEEVDVPISARESKCEPQSNQESVLEQKKRYQDSIIAANYTYQIEQLQLKHSRAIEQAQEQISRLKQERQIFEVRLSQMEQALSEKETNENALKSQLKTTIEKEMQSELNLKKMKKKMTQQVSTANEAWRTIKDQVQEKDKELLTKNEDIEKLKAKLQSLKVAHHARNDSLTVTQAVAPERRNSGVSQSAVTTKGTGCQVIHLGSKDQQVIVDIQTNTRKDGIKPHHSRTGKGSIGSQISTKMFANNATTSSIIQGTSRNTIQNTQQSMPTTISASQATNKKGGNTHHFKSQNNPNQASRSHTPNSRNGASRNRNKVEDKSHSNQRLQKYITSAVSQQSKSRQAVEQMLNYSENVMTTTQRKKLNHRRQNSMEECPSTLNKGNDNRQFYATATGGMGGIQGQTAQLFTTQGDLENVVRNLLCQFAPLDSQIDGQSTSTLSRGGIIENTEMSFSKRDQQHNNNLEGTASTAILTNRLRENNNCMYHNQPPMMMTLDKEFLIQLEQSLKKLAKSNQKVKQITREKEQFEKQYFKLKEKVSLLKMERSEYQQEKEYLIQQIHKLECRLKQAQVILNMGEQQDNSIRSKSRTPIEDNFRSASKSALKNFQLNFKHTAVDLSPNGHATPSHQNSGTKSKRSFKVNNEQQQKIQDFLQQLNGSSKAQQELPNANHVKEQVQSDQQFTYHQPPMTCRVTDSYEISLRLSNADSSQKIKKNVMFNQQQERPQANQSQINGGYSKISYNKDNHSSIKGGSQLDQSQITVKQQDLTKFGLENFSGSIISEHNDASRKQSATINKRDYLINQTPAQHHQSVSTSKFKGGEDNNNSTSKQQKSTQKNLKHHKSTSKDNNAKCLTQAQTSRLGKTPTLQINLSAKAEDNQRAVKQFQYVPNYGQNEATSESGEEVIEATCIQGSVSTSRNFEYNRQSLKNIVASAKTVQNPVISAVVIKNDDLTKLKGKQQQNRNQGGLLFGQNYQTNSSNIRFRSPPRIEAQVTEPPSYEKSVKKPFNPNQQMRPGSPKIVYNKPSGNNQSSINESISSVNILKKMNSSSRMAAFNNVSSHTSSSRANDRYFKKNFESQLQNKLPSNQSSSNLQFAPGILPSQEYLQNRKHLQPFDDEDVNLQNSLIDDEHMLANAMQSQDENHAQIVAAMASNKGNVHNQMKRCHMQICFDEEEFQDEPHFQHENNNCVSEEDMFNNNNDQEEEDELVDQLMDDTDEKQGSVHHQKRDFQQQSIYRTNEKQQIDSRNNNECMTSHNSINLGPNLNLQVNAIGHLRRRKRTTMKDQNRQEANNQDIHQEEEDDDEESVQFKMMNNSTVMPLKHSRYTNDN